MMPIPAYPAPEANGTLNGTAHGRWVKICGDWVQLPEVTTGVLSPFVIDTGANDAQHVDSPGGESASRLKVAGGQQPDGQPSNGDAAKVRCSTMADAAKVIGSIEYLVPNWIPLGMVTGFVAQEGAGKSALALWLARSIVMGLDWFTSQKVAEPRKVLWIGTENDLAITIERMRKWSMPMENILLPFDDPLVTANLTSPSHLDHIMAIACSHRPAAVFVDSLRSGHDMDENDSRVGRVLQRLTAIAERTKGGLIVTHHTRKLKEGEEITSNSSRGSNAITAMMRSQLGIDQLDKSSDWRRLQMLKENLGLKPNPIGFRITDRGLEFGVAPTRPKEEKPARAPARAEAREWLLELLKDGPVPSKDLSELAEVDHLNDKTLRNAMKELKVTRWKTPGPNGKWMTSLPSQVGSTPG
jgi:hypothetical protein